MPFVDAHTIEVKATPERVWDEIAYTTLRRLGGGAGSLGAGRVGRIGARMLGCSYVEQTPPGSGLPDTIVGFRIERAERPSLVALVGEHRYASYSFTFWIEPGDGQASRLTAETRAAFAGPGGRRYRKLIIGTGGHEMIAVRRVLSSIRRGAERS